MCSTLAYHVIETVDQAVQHRKSYGGYAVMKYVFIGGDDRTAHAVEYIKQADEHASRYCGSVDISTLRSELSDCDVLVLPFPLFSFDKSIRGITNVTLDEILSMTSDSAMILCGKRVRPLTGSGVRVREYGENEEYLMCGAYLTAEGALGHLLLEYPRELREKRIVLTGYGRIGKALYALLLPFTNNITVVARRREVIDELVDDGVVACDFSMLAHACVSADIVINTVPKLVFDNKVLSCMPRDAYLIELASAPGGFDKEAVANNGNILNALPALPGRCAPVSAGEALGTAVLKMTKTNGDE